MYYFSLGKKPNQTKTFDTKLVRNWRINLGLPIANPVASHALSIVFPI